MARLWMTRGDVEDFRRGRFIRIAYGFKRDLTALKDRAAIIAAMVANGSAATRNTTMAAGQLFRFAHEMSVGDRVLTYDKSRRVYLVGQIESAYQFDPEREPTIGNHVRKVKWVGEVSRDRLTPPARNSLGSLQTVFEPDAVVSTELESALRGEPDPQPDRSNVAHTPSTDISVEPSEAEELDQLVRDYDSRGLELIKDKIARLDWEDMQDLVASILRAMGYKTRVSPPGSDRGRDILASPDGLGLSPPRIKVEVKHRQSAMGAPDLRSFIGGLRGDDRGLYVSTGGFTREAQYEAERSAIPLSLLDLDDLTELFVQHYDAIDADGRALVPLKRVFFPA